MKTWKRFLALLLPVCMIFTMLPLGVSAREPLTEETAAVSEDSTASRSYYQGAPVPREANGYMRILHLDCGRKYFSPDWIKALINEMAADGYTHLQLAFGNEGLRFLLDDMSITAGGQTYISEDVKDAIRHGNKKYDEAHSYTPAADELTQAEMDDIILYAQSKNIEIIPLLNTPGHMNALVSAMGDPRPAEDADPATGGLGMESAAAVEIESTGQEPAEKSESTINLMGNQTAVDFTVELVQKYID